MKAGAPMICINDSGERAFRKAWMHWRDMGAFFITIPWLRGDPTDIRDYGAMRGRCCIFTGSDRFYLYGKKYKPDVYYRASVIAAVTGESVTAEELGGARTHNAISGSGPLYGRGRRRLYPADKRTAWVSSPEQHGDSSGNGVRGRLEPAGRFLNELIPENPGKPYDMKTVIEALADNGRLWNIRSILP